tara:strand:+ start:588 stop:1070 length:483 start_codon:yes stop_codon:yes gene_type:complete
MLRFKLIPTVNLAAYRIKINNKIIDQGILMSEDSLLWTQKQPEMLVYKEITFDNESTSWISVTCTNSGSGREIYIQEIQVDNVIIKVNANFGHEHIVSGCSKNIEAVMERDFSDVVTMDRAGTMGDWIFAVKPNGTVAFFDEHLYYEKQELQFTKEMMHQ